MHEHAHLFGTKPASTSSIPRLGTVSPPGSPLSFFMKLLSTIAAMFFLDAWAYAQTEIGFVEKFALAPNRAEVLRELVPGSEDFYFYHALHFQNSGEAAKYKETMEQWAARFPRSEMRKSIDARQVLQEYATNPKALLTFLRKTTRAELNHQQQSSERRSDLPTVLDPQLVSAAAFRQKALSESADLAQMEESALEQLVESKAELTAQQRRALLARLTRPDLANLVNLVATELEAKESRSFGEFPIHQKLLPEQLDELAKRIPGLLGNPKFVATRLRQMRPGADVDLAFDRAARQAWLERVRAYVRDLAPALNTYKAHILFHFLVHDREAGVVDRVRFIEYLKLPRRQSYVNPRFTEEAANSSYVDLQADLSEPLGEAASLAGDEWLVRACLLEIFKTEADWKPYAVWLNEGYVKPIFAEAKILAGAGNPEEWASLLSPQAYKDLRERVDLEFAASTPKFFAPDAEVSLDLHVKNAREIMVKIYEINTLDYFTSKGEQLNTDIDLDGLAANVERTHRFEDAASGSPFRQVVRTFPLPELKGRGAWIVDFIGGGKSSRALIRKGAYTAVQRTGPAGDMLAIVDEAGAPAPDAVAWFEGRRLERNAKTGFIHVPFSNAPGDKPIVLASANGDFASLATFTHHAEEYRLDAQFFLPREQVLAGRTATLAIRTAVLLNGEPLAPGLLLEPKLALTTTTIDNVSTTREIGAADGLKLTAEGVYTWAFPVADRLRTVQATLSGQIEKLSAGGERADLSAHQAWTINGIDATDRTTDLHLSKGPDGYAIDLLGKNGEPLPERPLALILDHWHWHYDAAIHVTLRTDAQGRAHLGALPGVEGIQATGDHARREWHLAPETGARGPGEIHRAVGEVIRLPWLEAGPLRRDQASLLEVRHGLYAADRFAALATVEGFLEIKDLPAGDYELRLTPTPGETRLVRIAVTGGKPAFGWLLSEVRRLEVRDVAPVSIVRVEEEPDAFSIQLANGTAWTRVHVATARFMPGEEQWSAAHHLSQFHASAPGAYTAARRPNLFVTGRDIGDEFRYILERRARTARPGNMLARPGLLLQPWDLRTTELDQAEVQGPGRLQRQAKDVEAAAKRMSGRIGGAGFGGGGLGGDDQSSNLDFLAAPAPALYNLRPDANGRVRIEKKLLGDRQHLLIYAEDLRSAVWRPLVLPQPALQKRDLRLTRHLDPAKPFVLSKQVTALAPGQTLALSEMNAAEVELYDSIASVYALYMTLSSDATLQKFAWITRWPELSEAEKRAKYSEFACHELNFFLSRKDAVFFDAVIRPYLAHKKDKTFMDEYLLGLDLRPHLELWRYERLNVAEKALLAQRIADEFSATERHLRELWELLPPDEERADRLFETALRGRGMEEESISSVSRAGREFAVGFTPRLPMPPPPPAAPLPASAPAAAAPALKEEPQRLRARLDSPPAELEMDFAGDDAVAAAQELRADVRPFFRRIGPTKEWAENNYYRRPIAEQDARLITINAFWRDFAAWDRKGPFFSRAFVEASRSFPEMMLALGALDLPFAAPKHETRTHDGQFTLTSGGVALAFHKEIQPARPAGAQGELLVSESFFRQGDRHRMEGNRQLDKYVTEEFLTGVVYGANVVVTNPTSSPLEIDLLLQIPHGALAVSSSKATSSRRLELPPYTTRTAEYFFYFPQSSGAQPFPHYPAHVAREGISLATAKPMSFPVVDEATKVDATSWDYISQRGTDEEVLTFLRDANVHRVDLRRVAWRARARVTFFRALTELLTARRVYSDAIWAYAIVHDSTPALREWLSHRGELHAQLGPWFSSDLLHIDPIERRAYQHLEYSPLINQRAHRLGKDHRILNTEFRAQYQAFLRILAHKPALDAEDRLSVTYYLFVQDRVEEALAWLATVKAEELPTRLQLDYLRCYAAFYEEQSPVARGIAANHAQHPVDRWRKLFQGVLAQADEIEGRAVTPRAAEAGAQPDREADQERLTATEPALDFTIEDRAIKLAWQNLEQVTLKFFQMDPEVLFSSSPFVTEDPARFSIVKPARVFTQVLPANTTTFDVPLPPEFQRANLLVEVSGAGIRRAQAYHANSLRVNVVENYGQLELRDSVENKQVSKAYVKVYARLHNGQTRFYKDGYTDLRGKFDYASLNGPKEESGPIVPFPKQAGAGLASQMLAPGELGLVERVAILVISEKHGVAVREAAPPAE